MEPDWKAAYLELESFVEGQIGRLSGISDGLMDSSPHAAKVLGDMAVWGTYSYHSTLEAIRKRYLTTPAPSPTKPGASPANNQDA
jgi:hypothetical protein